jgi:hypothetical protein
MNCCVVMPLPLLCVGARDRYGQSMFHLLRRLANFATLKVARVFRSGNSCG